MKKYTNQPIMFILLWATILVLTACQTTGKKAATTTQEGISSYDGVYSIVFNSSGVLTAATDIEVYEGAVSGTVVNTSNQTFEVKGSVSSSGTLTLTSTSNEPETIITAKGMINKDKTVEGSYSVAGRKGTFAGFGYDEEVGTRRYDGKYRILFLRNGQQVAATEITIAYGVFPVNITTSENETYAFEGYVLGDGQLVLRTVFSDLGTGVTAVGSISDELIISGIYYNQKGERGTFAGTVLEIGIEES